MLTWTVLIESDLSEIVPTCIVRVAFVVPFQRFIPFGNDWVFCGKCEWLTALVSHGMLSPTDQYFTLDVPSVSGAACLLFGLVIGLLEAKSLYKLTTFLQADFDEATSSPARVDNDRRRRPGAGVGDDCDELSAERTEIEFLPLAVMASEVTTAAAATSGLLATRRKSSPVLTTTALEPV
jgi:hypothetical protein